MDLKEEIRKLAMKCLENERHFVVDVSAPLKGRGKVLVTIDGDDGVGIDDCALVSTKLSKLIDEAGWLESQYILEVSTPGLDQPLKLWRQYPKNVGRQLKVRFGDQEVEGYLDSVLENHIVIKAKVKGKKIETEVVKIPFDQISKATVKVSFK